jgi:hypothetical protein
MAEIHLPARRAASISDLRLVQADAPPEAQRGNWLPSPKGADFSLYMRSYWPKVEITDGSWTPPPVLRSN